MTAIRTTLQNAFETTLDTEMGPNDLTADVASIGALTTPCYIVINMESDTLREYMLMDDTFGASTFVTTNISKRYLDGSAAGSNITHPINAPVQVVAMAQHFEDLHDRIESLDHGADLAGLADDDHPQYSLADGSRAFTGEIAGITPTVDASLARKDYVDTKADAVLPAGVIFPYAASPAPAGFLLADGAEVSRGTYAALFAAIGTAFGNGNGTTTFDLPDLRGRFPLGVAVSGTGSNLANVGGSLDPTLDLSHSHTVDSHTHDIGHGHLDSFNTTNSGAHTHAITGETGGELAGDGAGPNPGIAGSGHFHDNGTLLAALNIAHNHPLTGSVTSHAGSSGAATPGTDTVGSASASIPNAPFLALHYIIKT